MNGATASEVKARRSDAGLTQQEAANLVGISLQAWQNYEYDTRQIPESTWRFFKILTARSPTHEVNLLRARFVKDRK